MLFKHFNKATTEFYNKILIARINLNYFKLGHLRLPDKTVTKELRKKFETKRDQSKPFLPKVTISSILNLRGIYQNT